MTNRIKEVEFNFENCEFLTIPQDDIEYCCMSDFKISIEKCATNAILKQNIVQNVEFTLKKSANTTYICPYNPEDNKSSKFDRFLRCSDITQIAVKYEDGNEELFYTIWSNIDEYRNYYQQTILNRNGELEIRINKKLLTNI